MVGDRQLGDSRALPYSIDRDEAMRALDRPMHLAIKAHILDHLAPISLESAPVIVERHAEQG
jgi:hypothetical protein